jgi:hypothetical protein
MPPDRASRRCRIIDVDANPITATRPAAHRRVVARSVVGQAEDHRQGPLGQGVVASHATVELATAVGDRLGTPAAQRECAAIDPVIADTIAPEHLMSHGIHAVQHEVEHEITSGGHGGTASPIENLNKKVALLIGVLALLLAFSETLGKSAQTDTIKYNIEATNLWAFFQAKTIRRTVVLTASEEMSVHASGASDAALKSKMTKQIDDWKQTAQRYRSEPDVREGTVELAERAKAAEKKRDTALARYHHYEVASAAFQIGIVLGSATVITGMIVLSWIALGLGGLGVVFTLIGFFAPHAVHLF